MNILVTAIGSFSADCVIKTLKEKGHKVIGCDIYPSEWHAISKECDNVYKVPFATKEDEYIYSLINICLKEEIEYLIPLTDLEIDILNNHRDAFSKKNVTLCMQSEKCLNIARDKYAMFQLFFNDKNINVPFSISSEKLSSNFPIPAIAKPINGRSSEGLKIISNTKDLNSLIGINKYIVQECISGPIYTIDYVRDKKGNDFSIPREELLRTKNGAGTTIKITPNKQLENAASYIGNLLDVVGCINLEFISNDNKYYLIDINPRFSAGIAFSKFVGFDMVTSHLNCFLNKNILNPVNFNEQIICKRYYEELV